MYTRFKKSVALAVLLWVSAGPVYAARVVTGVAPQVPNLCDIVVLTVALDPEAENLNAVEGELVFPTHQFTLQEIVASDVGVHMWVERPNEVEPGKIIFSGVTPGGFSRLQEPLFTALFQATGAGPAVFNMRALRVLKNDGVGSVTDVTSAPLAITVRSESSTGRTSCAPVGEEQYPELAGVAEDDDPPEVFMPLISRSEYLFDGASFLIFATQDKGSGMDHYEVREGTRGSYTIAESPYLLQDQSLHSTVFVKAVDVRGNERVATIERPSWFRVYAGQVIIGIVGVLLLVIFFSHNRWRKFLRSF